MGEKEASGEEQEEECRNERRLVYAFGCVPVRLWDDSARVQPREENVSLQLSCSTGTEFALLRHEELVVEF